jgi:prepilin-type processing-associated H-X9-DG protein
MNQPEASKKNQLDLLRSAFPGLTDLRLQISKTVDAISSIIAFERSNLLSSSSPDATLVSYDQNVHDCAILEIPYRGSANVAFADGERFAVRPGSAALLTFHDWSMKTSGYAGLTVRVPKDELVEKVARLLGRAPELESMRIVDVSGEHGHGLLLVLRSLNGLYQKSFVPSSFYDDIVVDSLAIFLAREINSSDVSAYSGMECIVTHARRFVASRLDSPLTVSDVAMAVGVSVRYLQVCFVSVTGSSPKQWMLMEKLEMARSEVINNPSMSVAIISERYGFSSPTHFSMAFKRKFGFPPTRLRR